MASHKFRFVCDEAGTPTFFPTCFFCGEEPSTDNKKCLYNDRKQEQLWYEFCIPGDKKNWTPLQMSIAKWQGVACGTFIEQGWKNCALCMVYFKSLDFPRSCGECPVTMATQQACCRNTPYEKFTKQVEKAVDLGYVFFEDVVLNERLWLKLPDTFHSLLDSAKAEVLFLQSLTPTQEPTK